MLLLTGQEKNINFYASRGYNEINTVCEHAVITVIIRLIPFDILTQKTTVRLTNIVLVK
jgi:hypothetical protein